VNSYYKIILNIARIVQVWKARIFYDGQASL